MELNTARVFVDDIAAAKAFYLETLALPLKIDGERYGFCVFHSGGAELVVGPGAVCERGEAWRVCQ